VFDSLIEHGADVNFENERGINAMMLAYRTGSNATIELLKSKGAKPLDISSPSIKARLVVLDALLLEVNINQYAITHLMNGIKGKHARKELTWEFLWKTWLEEQWTPGWWSPGPEYLIVKNHGRDVFGNPFRLFASSNPEAPSVIVSDKTIEACREVVNEDFWKQFYVPREKWEEFISGDL